MTQPEYIVVDDIDDVVVDESGPMPGVEDKMGCAGVCAAGLKSCRLPQGARDSIRIGVGGKIYALQALPFGWKHSPSMAQAILG